MKTKYLFFAVAAIAAMSSCSNSDDLDQNEKKPLVFKASFENNNPGPKTALVTEGVDKGNVQWSKNDQISINGVSYTLSGDGGTTSGTFKATTAGTDATANAAGKYCAIYPSKFATNDGKISLPAEWSGKFEDIPMYAESTSTDLSFKNPFGVIAVKLKHNGAAFTGSARYTPELSAYFGNHWDFAKMSGTFDPSNIAQTLAGTGETVLKCAAWNGKDTFYFPICPGEYEEIELSGSDDYGDYTSLSFTKDNVTIVANKIYTITINVDEQ